MMPRRRLPSDPTVGASPDMAGGDLQALLEELAPQMRELMAHQSATGPHPLLQLLQQRLQRPRVSTDYAVQGVKE